MRKVIYKEWVHAVETEEYKQWKKDSDSPTIPQLYVEGTNFYIEKEGLFHGFFPTVTQNNEGGFGNIAEAWIELEDGHMVNVYPSLIRFVDTPETDQLAEFAKAAMQGLMTSGLFADMIISKTEYVSQWSVAYAKSLIAELKKHDPIESTGYTTPYLRIEQEQAYERMKALGINIHAQTFEQCVNDLLYRLENNNIHEQA